MKLETVSRIKGCVALVATVIWIAGVLYLDNGGQNPAVMFWSGWAVLVSIVYTVKWFRLRRRMRELEYARRIGARG